MNSDYRIEYSEAAEDDLIRIQRHLMLSAIAFGEDPVRAFDLADARERQIRKQTGRLALTPMLGTQHNDLVAGLRHVTLNRCVIWFIADHAKRVVQVLALFHGTEDHLGAMMRRLSPSE